MATLHPFQALRPSRDNAVRVAAPPYDVVNTREARELAPGNPDSYLHVSRPEIDLPEGTDEHADAVYARGARNLADFLQRGVLRADPERHLYVYAQKMGAHRQVGLVACASVAEYDAGLIKKHEKTRADKEDDRTRHVDEMGAHDEPVFLTYRASKDVDAAVAEVMRGTPEYDLTTQDGVEHRLWVAGGEASARIAELFRAVPALYVADGHHRSAAASRVHALRKGRPGEHDRFLAVVFPHDQMQILAYNRVVRDTQGRRLRGDPRRARAGVQPLSRRPPRAGRAARRSGSTSTGGGGARASAPAATMRRIPWPRSTAPSSRTRCCAHLRHRRPAPRHERRFRGRIRGAKELERRVDEEGWSVAFHLFPTRVDQLMAVSDAGQIMPPKSTWFEPKLRSGLFVHAF